MFTKNNVIYQDLSVNKIKFSKDNNSLIKHEIQNDQNPFLNLINNDNELLSDKNLPIINRDNILEEDISIKKN